MSYLITSMIIIIIIFKNTQPQKPRDQVQILNNAAGEKNKC